MLLKITFILRGQSYRNHVQLGLYENCFDCMWDSRYAGNQYHKKDWPKPKRIQ